MLADILRKQHEVIVRVLYTVRMPDQFCVNGPIHFAMAARAVADTARKLESLRDVRAVVADSVQRGWCRVAELARELDEGPSRGSARFRRVLAEVAAGVRSVAEAELRDLVKGSGLPTERAQVVSAIRAALEASHASGQPVQALPAAG